MNLFDKHPWTSPDVFVAPNATVVGSVDINTKSAVMYGAVIRGDLGKVDIGGYTTIQDRALIHTSAAHGGPEGSTGTGVKIGDYVIVGTKNRSGPHAQHTFALRLRGRCFCCCPISTRRTVQYTLLCVA